MQGDSYDTSQKAQDEAFETIQAVLETEGYNVIRKEEVRETMTGPKRMEITLVRAGVGSGKEEIDVVPLSCVPPNGAFNCYTIRGREWLSDGRLSPGTIAFQSNTWCIKKIETMFGNGRSNWIGYSSSSDKEPWKRVEEFYKKLSIPESNLLANWTPEPRDSDSDWDSYQQGYAFGGGGRSGAHYYNQSPSIYKPAVAFLRKAGDEIGAKLHLEQLERVQKMGVPSREELLAKIEKKQEAGEGTHQTGRTTALPAVTTRPCTRRNIPSDIDSVDRAERATKIAMFGSWASRFIH
jgi:hypothetical protein